MFRSNTGHLQAGFRSDLDLLTNKSRSLLLSSWASTFYEEFFCRIDEAPFAVLYAKSESRPNIPVNVLLSMEVLKSRRNWSDEDLRNAFLFDVLFRYAVGYRNLGEGDFDLRTLQNFRHRLVIHELETGEDLLAKAFISVTAKQMKALRLKSGWLRVDSTQISSNIRQMTRLQLLVEVIQRVHRMLSEADRALYAADLAPYLKGTSGHFVYRVRGDEARGHVQEIGVLMQRLVAELATLYGEHPTYKILCRVFQEQYQVVSRGAPQKPAGGSENSGNPPRSEPMDVALVSQILSEADAAAELADVDEAPAEPEPEPVQGDAQQTSAVEPRPGKEISPSSLRSPDDPDATYRKKGSRSYEGYATAITETCEPENPLQLIVKVQTDSNTREDAEFLREALPELKERTQVHTIYTDAGFCSHAADQDLRRLQVTQVPTGIRGHVPRPDVFGLADFRYDLDPAGGPVSVTCPHGHTATVEPGKKPGRYRVRLSECCRPTVNTGNLHGQKNGVLLRFSRNELDTALRRQRCRDYHQEGHNYRSAVESTVGAIKRPFTDDQLPVRGKMRMGMLLIGAAIMVNIRRIHRYRVAQRKAQARETRNNPGTSFLSALFDRLQRLQDAFRRPWRPVATLA